MEKLKIYHSLHGNDWKKIGEMVARSSLSVALKFSQIGSRKWWSLVPPGEQMSPRTPGAGIQACLSSEEALFKPSSILILCISSCVFLKPRSLYSQARFLPPEVGPVQHSSHHQLDQYPRELAGSRASMEEVPPTRGRQRLGKDFSKTAVSFSPLS